MPLSPEKRTRLIEILVANVPATTFAEVVREQRVVPDFDVIRKQAPEDPTEARRFIATRVVDAYDAAGRIPHLAKAVYRRAYRDDQFAPQILPYTMRDPAESGEDAAKEAAIVKRANTMSSRKLREFLDENESKVCLVVVANDEPGAETPLRMGTGFLVGPDTVLTAYHTLVDHIDNGKARNPPPGRCCAIFDYYEGDPLQALDPIPSGSVCVPFAQDWLIDWNQDMPRDGLFRQPDAQQEDLLCKRLDFALVRLAEPVGKQTRRRTGGPRRSWVKLSAGAVALAQDDRIIIPQHPNGYPQRIDFGRFSQQDSALDTSSTRLRYDTETDKGTSGAPCFDQRFSLVGMHNASFEPDGVDVRKNQAIRIDRILAALKAIPGQADAEPAPVRLWNTSTDAEPSVILGRKEFLDWLELAKVEPSRSCRERVYAASVRQEDLANNKGFGKRFTTEILKAARRGSAEPIVLLGTPENPLPDSVSDIIRAIAFQLGIDKAVLDTMPPRPSADLPSATLNTDKLHRWVSEDVPAWFDRVLGQYREQVVDLRDDARKRVAYLQAGGYAPSAEDLALAQQATPQIDTRRRWPIAWIVISSLLSARLHEEVRDLLAGMIGAKLTETSMPQQLRRLRWVFVGYVPDFLSSDQVTPETLDPRQIGSAELIEGMKLLADSMAISVDAKELNFTSVFIDAMTAPGVGNAAASDPTLKLAYFQRTLFPQIRANLMKLRGRG
jgi:hypothetical protein